YGRSTTPPRWTGCSTPGATASSPTEPISRFLSSLDAGAARAEALPRNGASRSRRRRLGMHCKRPIAGMGSATVDVVVGDAGSHSDHVVLARPRRALEP